MSNRLPMLKLCALAALSAPALATPIYSTDFQSPYDPAGLWSTGKTAELGDAYTTILGNFGWQTVNLALTATEANTADLPDLSGGGNNSDYNLTVREFSGSRDAVPYPDSGGGGGWTGSHQQNFVHDGPKLDLGSALSGGDSQPPSTDPLFIAGRYSLTFDLMLFDSWDANYDGYGPDGIAVSINGEKVFEELFEVHVLENNFRMPDELPNKNVYHAGWQDQIYRDITLEFVVTEATDLFSFDFLGTPNQALHDESWGLDNVRVDFVSRSTRASSPEVPAPASRAILGAGLGLTTRRRR